MELGGIDLGWTTHLPDRAFEQPARVALISPRRVGRVQLWRGPQGRRLYRKGREFVTKLREGIEERYSPIMLSKNAVEPRFPHLVAPDAA